MRFTIKTIGCKVNTYESNKLIEELQNFGFEYVDVEKKEEFKNLDVYIINTCSVTSIADKKSRQMIHKARSSNSNIIIIAIGCMIDSLMLNNKDMDVKKLLSVDYVIPNSKKESIANTIKNIFTGSSSRSLEFKNSVRAFVKIQDGCNQYCSYCIIPFLRGNIKSRDESDILEEIRKKSESGVKEIVLTGIHLSSFGLEKVNKTYESEGAIEISRKNLLSILTKISEIEKIERIRLGSLEPRIIDEFFVKSLISGKLEKKFCANFCLSLQSGSDKILKLMNRHYTVKEYESACEIIRKYIPFATITTDIIVGFPGEDIEDFNETINFAKKIRFYNPNIFPYSRRKGTRADKFDNQLSNHEKHDRAKKLIEICNGITSDIEKEYNLKYPEKSADVLVEETFTENGILYGVGYTKEYIRKKIVLKN